MEKLLPEFGKPPLSEVAISMQFTPLHNWRGPHAGIFWGEIIEEYPKTSSAPPLPHVVENFEELIFQSPQFNVTPFDAESQRTWFLSEDETKLIQLQNDRFILNWRKIKGDEIYPRYSDELRPRFIKEWSRFRKFVSERDLGVIENVQGDVTYVNDIVQGDGWNTFNDAIYFLSNWIEKGTDGFLPPLETLNINGSFQIPSGSGRLYFFIQHVLRQLDNKQTVQLRLSARGNPHTSSDDDIINWMDLAREWVVRGFTDLTSKSAHKLWDRKR